MLRKPIKAAACLHRSALDLLPCTSSIKNAISSGTPLGSEEHALSSADKAASVPGGPKSLRLRAGAVGGGADGCKTREHAWNAVGSCLTYSQKKIVAAGGIGGAGGTGDFACQASVLLAF